MKRTLRQPTHNTPAIRKLSFILRLWSVDQGNTSDWRASLEILGTGERLGFASLEELFAFLIDFTDIKSDSMTAENYSKET
jgi:hypothetical protein